MNRAEFDSILVDHYDELVAWCKCLTNDEETSYDLAHDTILKAIEACGDFSPDNPRAWLFTIAKNCFINDIKKKKLVLYDCLEHEEPGSNNPYLPGEGSNSIDLYEAAIASLPAGMAEAFALREKGFTTSQIAKALNIPLGTVKSRLFYASKKICEFLLDNGE
jgi:RNA polymerase sigma factor (sigma-70 family)